MEGAGKLFPAPKSYRALHCLLVGEIVAPAVYTLTSFAGSSFVFSLVPFGRADLHASATGLRVSLAPRLGDKPEESLWDGAVGSGPCPCVLQRGTAHPRRPGSGTGGAPPAVHHLRAADVCTPRLPFRVGRARSVPTVACSGDERAVVLRVLALITAGDEVIRAVCCGLSACGTFFNRSSLRASRPLGGTSWPPLGRSLKRRACLIGWAVPDKRVPERIAPCDQLNEPILRQETHNVNEQNNKRRTFPAPFQRLHSTVGSTLLVVVLRLRVTAATACTGCALAGSGVLMNRARLTCVG